MPFQKIILQRTCLLLILKNTCHGSYYRRIGHAIDAYTDHILDEGTAYDEAASTEEERSISIRKILSRIVNLNNADTNAISEVDEDSAIQW